MKSPITGKEMNLVKEKRPMVFRKETFEIVFHYYKCEDSEEQFTTTSIDEVNMNQVYNQYRGKFNIPFPEEIIRIREKYGVSAKRMSSILGFGTNSYRQYEAGEMPSVSNARLIQMVNDPKKFIEIIELSEALSKEKKDEYIRKAQILIEHKKRNIFKFNLKDYLLGNHLADIYSGYRSPSFEKFTEMVVFFAREVQPFKTKMNKLLFYADFLMFKESCFSISGVRYNAINMGPVPNNFQSIFEYLANNNDIEVNYTNFPQGYIGEQFTVREDRAFKEELFSNAELDILHKIANTFKETTTNDIVQLSHLESAWKDNKDKKNIISYEYAFDLNQI